MLQSVIYTDACTINKDLYVIGYVSSDGSVNPRYKKVKAKDINKAELAALLFCIESVESEKLIKSDNTAAVKACQEIYPERKIEHCSRYLNLANNYVRAIKESFTHGE